MEDRMTELETKVAYQDQIIEELNNVVIELRLELESLAKHYKKISETLDGDNIKDVSLEVPPPHY